MVDFLGGRGSHYFQLFQQTCVDIFNLARRWYLCFYAILFGMVYDGRCSKGALENIMEQVYAPGTDIDVAIDIEERIDRASSGANWTDSVTDMFHHMFHK